MAYTINRFSGEELIVLQDGTIDTTTSIGLVGRNYVGYGETQNENFVFLLENFANDSAPARPISGQTWFDTSANLMNVYDGTDWKVLGSAILSATAPSNPADGNLWLKTPDNQLYMYTGAEWLLVGPESAVGFGATKALTTIISDTVGRTYPVIKVLVDDNVVAIISSASFTISAGDAVTGFDTLDAGINLSTLYTVKGNLNGIAETANRLETPRRINGVTFDGSQDITLSSTTTNRLVGGEYILGNDFDGSSQITWDIDATSANQVGKIVARNSAGGFSAGTITADEFVGDLSGNVSVSEGTSTFNIVQATRFIGATLSGNALTATQLQNAVEINGVAFDGSQNVTVPAAAGTLTGSTISPSVTFSSLERLGLLESLRVLDAGIQVGSGNQFKVSIDGSSNSVLTAQTTNRELKLELTDSSRPTGAGASLLPSSLSLAIGGDNAPALVPISDGDTNLGNPNREWNKVYANNLIGNADTATLASSTTNIAGGGAGSVPYQTAVGTTAFVAAGTPGYVLTAQSGNGVAWAPASTERLSKKVSNSYLVFDGGVGTYYDGTVAVTLSVDADTANTASKVVARDGSGNFSAGTITADLTGDVTGNVSGNAGSATRLQTARTINGVSFNGTANITIQDSTKVPTSGGTMTGRLTLSADPTQPLHAVTKQYVDALGLGARIWAGATTLSNVKSTYSSFPVGTTVSFWQERVYTRGSGNGAALTVNDRFKRTVRKTGTGFNDWSTVA